MINWYKISVYRIDDLSPVCKECKRLGMKVSDEPNRFSFIAKGNFKNITLLLIKFPDIQVDEFNSMFDLLTDRAKEKLENRDFAKFQDLFDL